MGERNRPIGRRLMKKLFSTTDVDPRHRFDYWHSVACDNLVGHSSTPECRQTFNAELRSGMLAGTGLVLFENSAMDVARTAKHVAQAQSDDLFICHQTAGLLTLEQDGRQLILGVGDVTLVDPNLPYAAKFSAASELLVVKVARGALEARVGRIRDLTAIALRPSNPENRWTSSFLAMLPSISDRLTFTAQEIASNQIVDLVAMSLLGTYGSARSRISSWALSLLRVRSAIEARLSDPKLNAATVAEAAGVSVRHANDLLAKECTSIMRLVLAMRLQRCRQALEDPLQNHRTVSEIARGWGFSDMTHFGRSFKAMYGMLPRDFRKAGSLKRSQLTSGNSTS
ncbi:AraC family transcriptional regulator [Bradyrhizobium sp. UFLA03-84]|nr:AraC family transcriptional regulator [Bradyrhizobium sp. UFLA03-84]